MGESDGRLALTPGEWVVPSLSSSPASSQRHTSGKMHRTLTFSLHYLSCFYFGWTGSFFLFFLCDLIVS